jgi:hypothetical protein
VRLWDTESREAKLESPLPEGFRPESVPAPRRALQALVILLALGAAVYVLLPQITAIENSARVLRSLSWWAVALALVAQCFCYLCHGVVVRLLLRLFDQALPLWRSIALGTHGRALCHDYATESWWFDGPGNGGSGKEQDRE